MDELSPEELRELERELEMGFEDGEGDSDGEGWDELESKLKSARHESEQAASSDLTNLEVRERCLLLFFPPVPNRRGSICIYATNAPCSFFLVARAPAQGFEQFRRTSMAMDEQIERLFCDKINFRRVGAKLKETPSCSASVRRFRPRSKDVKEGRFSKVFGPTSEILF